jgi:hypothetical protein
MSSCHRSHFLAIGAETKIPGCGLIFGSVYLDILTNKALGSRWLFVTTPVPLFDILGYLFALAIHDDVFATGVADIDEVYWLEIPPHRNDVKLEVEETKLGLAVFCHPARSVDEYQILTAMELLGCNNEANSGHL